MPLPGPLPTLSSSPRTSTQTRSSSVPPHSPCKRNGRLWRPGRDKWPGLRGFNRCCQEYMRSPAVWRNLNDTVHQHRCSNPERVWVLLRLSRRSSLDDETIYPPTCEPQARANVFEFKVGHLLDNFLGRKTVC